MPVAPGDHVVFPASAGVWVEVEEERLLVCTVSEVLGVLEEIGRLPLLRGQGPAGRGLLPGLRADRRAVRPRSEHRCGFRRLHEALKTRLLTVGPDPGRMGRRPSRRGDALQRDPARRAALAAVATPDRAARGPHPPTPPPASPRRRGARSPLPVFMQPEDGRPRRYTRLLVERGTPRRRPGSTTSPPSTAPATARVQAQVAPEVPIGGRRPRMAGDPDQVRRAEGTASCGAAQAGLEQRRGGGLPIRAQARPPGGR